MTLALTDARLDVYYPDNQSTAPADADVQVSPPEFEQLSVSPRLNNLVDQGRVTISNDGGTYTDQITSGDRVEFYIRREGDASLNRVWTGMVRNTIHRELGGGNYDLELTVDDFVFGVLDVRTFTGSFSRQEIAGSSNAILNSVLREAAPEIGVSQLASITDTVSTAWNGVSLLTIVQELSERADAVASHDGTDLVFEPLANVATEFGLSSADRGLADVTENDDSIANRLRVNGGTDVSVEAEQTTVDSYTNITDSTRLQVQVDTRKSELSQVHVWTRLIPGSTEDVVVRLHPNDSDTGTPLAPADRESDVVARRLSQEFLTDDGFTTFLMPEHTLPDRNPWILIESTGSTGQEIGVNASNVPAYRAFFPFPVDILYQTSGSVQKYRERHRVLRNEALTDRQALIDYARSVGRHTSEPDRELSFPAESKRAHLLTPGDIVSVNEPAINATSDYIVTVVNHSYNSMTLETDITAQDTSTV